MSQNCSDSQSARARYGNAENVGRILVLAKRPRYLVVTKESMEDERISLRARGLLAYLLCQPPHWVVLEKQLVRHLSKADRGEGRDAIRTALRELTEHGYFRRQRRRNARGQFVYVTVVFEHPQIYEQRYRQGNLFEAFMQEVVPGSVAEDDPTPPPLFNQTEANPERNSSARTNGSKAPQSRSESKNGVHGVSAVDWKSGSGKPGAGKPEADEPTPGNPTLVNPDEVSNDVSNPDETKNEERSAAAEARARKERNREENRKALIEAGIGEPTLTELADLDGLTPATIRGIATACREDGKRTGAIVENLRTAAEYGRDRAARQQHAGEAADAQAAEQRRAEEQDRYDWREVNNVLNQLTDDEFQRLAEYAKRKHPSLSSANPQKNRVLRIAMADYLRDVDRPRLTADQLQRSVADVHTVAKQRGWTPLQTARMHPHFPDEMTDDEWEQIERDCGFRVDVSSGTAT